MLGSYFGVRRPSDGTARVARSITNISKVSEAYSLRIFDVTLLKLYGKTKYTPGNRSDGGRIVSVKCTVDRENTIIVC